MSDEGERRAAARWVVEDGAPLYDYADGSYSTLAGAAEDGNEEAVTALADLIADPFAAVKELPAWVAYAEARTRYAAGIPTDHLDDAAMEEADLSVELARDLVAAVEGATS